MVVALVVELRTVGVVVAAVDIAEEDVVVVVVVAQVAVVVENEPFVVCAPVGV